MFLAIVALGAGLGAQEPGELLCGACKTTGRMPYAASSKWEVEHEGGETWQVLRCADALDEGHQGTAWRVCERCKTPSVQAAAQADWDAMVAADEAWLAERRRVDEVVDDECAHVETTHFIISWSIPKYTTDAKRSYRPHEAAHLFAARMEDFYARYQQVLGVTDDQNMRNKHIILALEKQRQLQEAGPVFAGISGRGTVRRSGGEDRESVMVLWRNKSEHPKDGDFLRHWIHNMVHQLTAVYYDPYWFSENEPPLTPPWLNDKYGWLDAGLAHWFEMDLDGKATTFCFQEQDTTARWRGSDWQKNIHKAVSTGDVPDFPTTVGQRTPALTAKQHQFVWSWIDYLMSLGGPRTAEAIRLAKKQRAARDILKEAYDVSFLGFEDAWAAWALEAYDPMARKAREARNSGRKGG